MITDGPSPKGILLFYNTLQEKQSFGKSMLFRKWEEDFKQQFIEQQWRGYIKLNIQDHQSYVTLGTNPENNHALVIAVTSSQLSKFNPQSISSC